jgi:uncharacterized membrane protein YsdA (DUF1294 family)
LLRVLIAYLVLVNVLAYGVYWLDKRRASRGGARVSENELLLWALAGGSPGAWLAMRRLRHKTQKTSFRVYFYGIVLLQIVGVWFLVRG